MANRQQGFGLTAELEKKKMGKYDTDLETQARDWIEAVIGEPISDKASPLGYEDFGEALKSGVHLCKLMNTLQPGCIKKVNTSSMAFKMMENISKFLEASGDYGVKKTDLFQTVDLYEKQNIGAVVNGIHALGRRAQAAGWTGPCLGPKESAENKREFSEEQLKAGQNVIGLQMGSNKGASQAGQNFGKARHIID